LIPPNPFEEDDIQAFGLILGFPRNIDETKPQLLFSDLIYKLATFCSLETACRETYQAL
jgi:hypothetical protein